MTTLQDDAAERLMNQHPLTSFSGSVLCEQLQCACMSPNHALSRAQFALMTPLKHQLSNLHWQCELLALENLGVIDPEKVRVEYRLQ